MAAWKQFRRQLFFFTFSAIQLQLPAKSIINTWFWMFSHFLSSFAILWQLSLAVSITPLAFIYWGEKDHSSHKFSHSPPTPPFVAAKLTTSLMWHFTVTDVWGWQHSGDSDHSFIHTLMAPICVWIISNHHSSVPSNTGPARLPIHSNKRPAARFFPLRNSQWNPCLDIYSKDPIKAFSSGHITPLGGKNNVQTHRVKTMMSVFVRYLLH